MFRLLLKLAPFSLALMGFQSPAFACELRASWEPWAPYQFKTEQGTLTGLDNDLLHEIAAVANCEIRLIEVPWKRALTMLKAGKLDVTAGASHTKERAQQFLFSRPYRSESVALFVHLSRANTFNYERLENLANSHFMFGIVRGYYYGETFKELKMSGQLIGQTTEAITDEQNFKKLMTGRVSGVLADTFVGSAIIVRNEWQTELKRMPTLIHQSDIHFIFSRKNGLRPVRDRFNQAIESLKQSGKIDSITSRYLH